MIRIHITQKDLDRARNTTLNSLHHAIKRRLKKPADVSIYPHSIYIRENTGRIDSCVWIFPIPDNVINKLRIWNNGNDFIPCSFVLLKRGHNLAYAERLEGLFKK